jgi:hypothetical protein
LRLIPSDPSAEGLQSWSFGANELVSYETVDGGYGKVRKQEN